MTPKFRIAVYAHHRRADGTYNVKICVYFNGKERRLPTNINCTREDLTRTFHIKNQNVISKCNREIERMQEAVSEISVFDMVGKDVDWLVGRIRTKLAASSFRLDFFKYADDFIATRKTESTRAGYVTALNAFEKFLGIRKLDINDITRSMVLSFIEYWDAVPKQYYDKQQQRIVASPKNKRSMQSSVLYASRLGYIFNEAKRRFNDEDEDLRLIVRNPFDNLPSVNCIHEGQSPLSRELMQKIILADVSSRRPAQRMALNVLVVSFCLMGINIADLLEADCPKGDYFVYFRKKTRNRRQDKAEMRILVPEQVKPYLRALGAGTGKKWLPALVAVSASEKEVSRRINMHIRRWCEDEGIEPFTFYAIRKTWATLARRAGVEKSIVDECLVHTGDYSLTDIYAEKPWHQYDEANAKVLNLFEWKRED